MNVARVEDVSQLLSALRKCRDDQDKIKNVPNLSEKVIESNQS